MTRSESKKYKEEMKTQKQKLNNSQLKQSGGKNADINEKISFGNHCVLSPSGSVVFKMINKKRIEELRNEIELERECKYPLGSTDYSIRKDKLIQLNSKLSSTILAHNNCLEDFSGQVKKEVMRNDIEDYGDYSKNKICACGSHKLSHSPHYIDDEEVCGIINKIKNEMRLRWVK